MNPKIVRFPTAAKLGYIPPMATRPGLLKRLWRWLTGYERRTANRWRFDNERRKRRLA